MTDLVSSDTDVCPICGGLGLVIHDVPIEHPDFGKAFPCVCQTEKLKTRKLEQLRKLGNLDAYANKTFATFQVDYDLLSEDQAYLRGVCTNLRRDSSLTEAQRRQINTAADLTFRFANEPKQWILMQGPYGTGKTHLAAAIAAWRVDQGESALLITVPDLLDHLRATYGPTSEIAYDAQFDQIRNAPLLILDDLGAESATEWAREKLYQLFGYRYMMQLPTVITTNNDPETMDGRIRSRLRDAAYTRQISLAVPDWRSGVTAWQDSDLGNLDRYREMTFESFDLREDEGLPSAELKRIERAAQIARYFAESPRGWLVLMGEPGCGKTHLAAAIAHECKHRGVQTLFVTASELLDHLRVTFYPGSQVSFDKRMEEIKQASVLVLDNLTVDKNMSSWARDKLFEILMYRFDLDLPTVITTYQTLQDMDARLKSRITNEARSEVVAITAPSYPGKARKRRAAPPRRA